VGRTRPSAERRDQSTSRGDGRRATTAAAAGNFVEWYDFGLYGFLAPTIAAQFFPTMDRPTAIMASLVIFGVAFLARPLGSLVFGHLGDRLGRRRILSAVILLMSVSTFAVGVLPSTATLGLWAPLLLLAARMTQGFSAGGELGGAIAFVTEHAPASRRGRYGSSVFFTQLSGSIAAAVVVGMLTWGLGDVSMGQWGWRIPFLLALPLGVVGVYLRLATRETPSFVEIARVRAVVDSPLRTTLRHFRPQLVQMMGIVVTATTTMLMITAFIPSVLVTTGRLTASEALMASVAGLSTAVVLSPAFGALSDKVGRRPVMIATPIAAITLALPAFWLFATGGTIPAVIGSMLLGLVLSPFAGAGPAALAELFPTSLRYSGLALGSAVPIAVVGGFVPVLLAWMVEVTGSLLAPAGVLAVFGVVSLVAAGTLREAAGVQWEREHLTGSIAAGC
jgi:MFS transporter, MHS family, proline/betaine transporter